MENLLIINNNFLIFMKVFKSSLKELDTRFSGYLEGKVIDEFFEEFDIKFAAGHWAAGDFVDRFATQGYNIDDPSFKSDILSQIDRVHKAGVKGIEFHDVLFIKDGKMDEDMIGIVVSRLEEYGMVATNMNMNLWTHPKWKMGALTNPSPKVREDALNQALMAVDIAKKVGCGTVALWPGSDGWDYNFEVNYGKQLDLFIEGCIEINKAAKEKGLGFGVEAKLHEPREGNMIIPTTHLSALVAIEVNKACGGNNMGVAIDYGHEQMYAVEPAATIYALKRFGVPLRNFHINTAKLHSNDEDRVAGTGDIWRMIDFCYAAVDTGYEGWFGEDQFTYRMDPIQAMRLSKEIFANLMKKALKLYVIKDKLEEARDTGDQALILDTVKKIVLMG